MNVVLHIIFFEDTGNFLKIIFYFFRFSEDGTNITTVFDLKVSLVKSNCAKYS